MTSKTEDGANRRRRLLVTGVPTDAVVERANAEFDAQFWREADPIGDRLLDVASGFEAVLIMPDDKLDAERIGRLPASVEVLGTHSVGDDHIEGAGLEWQVEAIGDQILNIFTSMATPCQFNGLCADVDPGDHGTAAAQDGRAIARATSQIEHALACDKFPAKRVAMPVFIGDAAALLGRIKAFEIT
mgnify:CR=1 FL=1